MGLLEIDRDAARAAYDARDEVAFARVIAPLGIDLSIATLETLLAKDPTAGVVRVLETIMQALTDDHGLGMAWARVGSPVVLARREATSILVGLATRMADRMYGFPEVKRWNGEMARNRAAMDRWAAAPDRARDSIRVPIRARLAASAHEAELLAAVVADPDDDAARLVLADHLIERGDPRGELVQCQCRLATSPEPRDSPLHMQSKRVLARCREAFRRDVAGAEHVVRRGFIDEVTLTVPALARLCGKLFAKHPIRTLVVKVRTDAHLAQLAKLAPQLPATIARIVLDGTGTYETSVSRLDLGMPALAELYRRGGALHFKGMGASAPTWRAALAMIRARELGVVQCWFDPTIFEALADRRIVPELVSLAIEQIGGNPTLTPEMLDHLRAIGARLESLTWTPLVMDGYDTGAALRAWFERATISMLGNDAHWPEGIVEPLLELPQARHLHALRVLVDAPLLAAIATSPGTANVVEAWARLPVDMPPDERALVGSALARSRIERVVVSGGGAGGRGAVPEALAALAPNVTFLERGHDGTLHLAASD